MEFQELLTRYASHYQITKLRVEQGKTFREIAELYQVSNTRVRQKYRRFLWALLRIYVKYLIENMEDDSLERHLNDVLNFYDEPLYSIAYLESVYKDILDECRKGVPPVITVQFPAFREISPDMRRKLERQIVVARDVDKRKFSEIGREMGLTKEKTESLYWRCKMRAVLGDEERGSVDEGDSFYFLM